MVGQLACAGLIEANDLQSGWCVQCLGSIVTNPSRQFTLAVPICFSVWRMRSSICATIDWGRENIRLPTPATVGCVGSVDPQARLSPLARNTPSMRS